MNNLVKAKSPKSFVVIGFCFKVVVFIYCNNLINTIRVSVNICTKAAYVRYYYTCAKK